MTTISSLFNTGTGRSSITQGSNTIPSQVENLIVLNQLTVNGNSFLQGDVEVGQDLVVVGNTDVNSIGVSGDLSVSGDTSVASIGTDVNSQFQLPVVQGTVDQVLTIDSVNPTQTEWKDSQLPENFVRYSAFTDTLQDNTNGVISIIENLKLVFIGQVNAGFKLPTVQGNVGDVLAIDSVNPTQTEWQSSTVTDYVSYDNATNELQDNTGGVTSKINNIVVGDITSNNNGQFLLLRRDLINATTRTQVSQFDNAGILLRSFPTSGGDPDLRIQVDPPNKIATLKSTDGPSTKEVSVGVLEAKLSSTTTNNQTNKVEATVDRLIFTSTGTGAANNGILLSTDSGNRYIKMPQNAPKVGDTIRVTSPLRSGTLADPDLTRWDP